MRAKKLPLLAAAALTAQILAGGCLVFPQIEDRTIELAAGGSVITTFVAVGNQASFAEDTTIVISDAIDLHQVLSDAGIDVSDVKRITLAGVSYRIVAADPDPAKQIAGGNITVNGQPLITGFSAAAGAPTGWITLTPEAAGVTQIDDLLASVLGELQAGTTPNDRFTYHVDGTISPAANTDFAYQLRLTLSIVGTVKVKVID